MRRVLNRRSMLLSICRTSSCCTLSGFRKLICDGKRRSGFRSVGWLLWLPGMTDRGAALSKLAAAFDNQLSVAQAVRQQHASGEGIAAATLPDAVFFAQSTVDVAAAVRLCARHRLPIIPFGVGTSLEGHVDAIDGGLTISLARLDRVLAINQSDSTCMSRQG